MSDCSPGSLESIRPPVTPDECGCECTMSDLTYTGESFPCFDVVPGSKLDTFLSRIGAKVCEIASDITVTDVDWGCIPNTTAPTGGTVTSNFQFLADELIPRSGNDCACPITSNLYFSDTKGIYQCGEGQNDGYVQFSGNYTNINGENQVRVLTDLKVTNGFSAGYTETTSTIDLSALPTDSLNYSYGIDASGGNKTITLTQIAAASNDHKNRRFSIRRTDCTVANTVTIQAFAGETIENAASVSLPVGHSYIVQADDATNDWVIVAEYYGCTMAAVGDNIYITNDLGVGDSTPDAKIDVVTTDTTQVTAIFENTGAASVDLVEIKRNGSIIDVFDSAGNLGVGVAVPLARAHAKLPAATGGTDNVFLGTTSTGTLIFQAAIDAAACFAKVGNTGFGENSVRINGVTSPTTFNGVSIQNSDVTVYSIGQKPNDNLTISATSSFTGGLEILKTNGRINLKESIYQYNAVAPTNGQLLIGDGSKFVAATLTEGRGIDVVNSSGGITVQRKGTVQTVSTDTTLGADDYVILVDSTGGNVNIQLPAAASSTDFEYTIKKLVAGNSVVIQCAGAETLDGSNSKTLSNQYASRTIVCSGAAWYITSLI